MARDRDDDSDRRDDDDSFDRPRGRSDGSRVRSKVSGPAIGLIAVGVISLLMIALGIVQYPGIAAQIEAAKKQVDDDPKMPADQKEMTKKIFDSYGQALAYLPVQWVVAGLASVVVIVGGVKMKNLTSLAWARWASVLAMIPCVSGCCLLGLPIGIWALTVLAAPEVKAAFAGRSGAAGAADEQDDWGDGAR
ncbi:hypothetical protein [Fimbriiglobus ruber]|uniref:Uncharacterized protein n=1 Tax=Fimbriiglobus ruber TaxID=1908690 RepID=A0A225DUP2_9BACT|nr:hypothetical protein [Fimbriiglobus ruber]OWK45051.1 hypothetical protein FRUB_01382 [Fimbriiglobus ruber]